MTRGSDLRMRGQGIGSAHQFVCMRCNQARPTLGRKHVTWRRVKTFVCAECAKAMAADKVAA